jgi:hypothetical protein
MVHTALKCFAVACLAIISQGQAVAALLDGQTVETTNFHGTAPDATAIIGPELRVVGPGVELVSFGWLDFLNIDFSDTNILISLATDQPLGFFEVIRFFDVNGTIPAFTGISVNPATNYAGFNASLISEFDSDVIALNLTGLNGLQGQQISLDLNGATPVPVHEPATIWLLVVGTTTLVAWRRREISRALSRA